MQKTGKPMEMMMKSEKNIKIISARLVLKHLPVYQFKANIVLNAVTWGIAKKVSDLLIMLF